MATFDKFKPGAAATKWSKRIIYGSLILIAAIVMIARHAENQAAEAEVAAAAASAAAASAALAAITPQQYADAFAAFEKGVADRLRYSELQVEIALGNYAQSNSPVEQSTGFSAAADNLRSVKALDIPKPLAHLPSPKGIKSTIELLLSIRSRAMRDGVEYLDTRKPSLVAEMQGKLQRANAHAIAVRTELEGLKASLPQ